MDDLLQEFLDETTENLEALDHDVLELEKNPHDGEKIARIFRLVHTIKGNCGFLALPRLEMLAHHAENVLGKYRDGGLSVDESSVSLIFAACDRIKSIVHALKETGAEPKGDDRDLIAWLDEAKTGNRTLPGAMQPLDEHISRSFRINVDVMEDLMTMMGELVLVRNHLAQISRQGAETPFAAPLQQLHHVVSALQEGIVGARLQPVSNAWGRLPRLVRDTAIDLGKKIRLETSGGETEIDRQVLEALRDPLAHLIRNAADHGIETPQERASARKSVEGVIRLAARQESGSVIITVEDDGRGLDLAKIGRKAAERNIITQDQWQRMDDKKRQALIFAPGFSTADNVTAISGRGVGLDIVRANVEKIGGTVDVSSASGKTAFTLRIPITLSIISALVFIAGGEKYALPQAMVRELVKLPPDVESVQDMPVMRLRGAALPLVNFSAMLGGNAEGAEVIVVSSAAGRFGILADKVIDMEEIVVKLLPPALKGIALFSGTTVLGDGRVIMIADPNGIAAEAGIMPQEIEPLQKVITPAHPKTALLVFQGGEGEAAAVPLSLVARIEHIDVGAIEKAGSRKVVQYRGKLIPLLPFSAATRLRTAGLQTVIVFNEGEKSVGMMVETASDIIEDHVKVQLQHGKADNIIGSAIVQGRTLDIVDVGHYLGFAHQALGQEERQAGKRVLLVDDSRFFRNMLTPMLDVAGYHVVTVEDPQEALHLCRAGEKFDIILSDIEMPGMNGFEFARAVRSENSGWKKTPLVALSAHATAYDVKLGRAAGFDDYITKFDRESLLRSIAHAGQAA